MPIKNNKKISGFTLMELMIAIAILIIALTGLLAIFARLLSLNENARKLTLATVACQDKMEQIRKSDFSTLYAAYNGTNFDPSGFPAGEAKGAVSIDNTDPKLLKVYVSVSWRERSNRVIGEDKNLNGTRDAGEDVNTNGMLDSPAALATLMAQR